MLGSGSCSDLLTAWNSFERTSGDKWGYNQIINLVQHRMVTNDQEMHFPSIFSTPAFLNPPLRKAKCEMASCSWSLFFTDSLVRLIAVNCSNDSWVVTQEYFNGSSVCYTTPV